MTGSIGVFDSGIGGLGILAETRRLLPTADLVYVADHSHSPYGVRTLDDLRRRCDDVTDWLIDQGCRVITLACNTASAAALHSLRDRHADTAFVGMEPAVKPAARATGTGRVGVVATAATFQGELFASVVDRYAAEVEVVTAACPRWVELVEEGRVSDDEVRREVSRCLAPMIDAEIDVLVLACTHYPALIATITDVLGPDVTIIDPAPAVARQTARIATERWADHGNGVTTLFSTADSARLAAAAQRQGIVEPVSLLRLP